MGGEENEDDDDVLEVVVAAAGRGRYPAPPTRPWPPAIPMKRGRKRCSEGDEEREGG